MDETVRVYTDGGCSGNPGPGGWAYLARFGSRAIEGSGGDSATTNNRMELTAVIEALERVRTDPELSRAPVDLYTDSMYVKNGITSWVVTWERNGWRTSGKKPVKNKDLWQELRRLSSAADVRWHWVAGHEGVELNEAAHALVQREIERVARRAR